MVARREQTSRVARVQPVRAAARREQIKGLLTAARARIDPCEVGIRRAGKLRSPGLRREDVAVLAGMSVKWYTWLEQGREMNFSADVLDRVASVLRLSPSQRAYLGALTQRAAGPTPGSHESISESLARMVRFMPVPTIVMSRRWDILAWNELTIRVFRDYSTITPRHRNLLRIVLTDEKYQSDPRYFEEIARKLLRQFRIDFGQFAGDVRFEALVAELKDIVPGFERWWQDVEISDSICGISLIEHDELGNLVFDRHSYVVEDHSFHRVLLFTPRNAATARAVDAIRTFERDADEPGPRSMLRISDGLLLRHPNRH